MNPNAPALAAPAGQTSNFDNPVESRRRYTYMMTGICLMLSTIAVGLRVFTKAKVLRSMNVEEYILILSQFGLIAFAGVLIHATQVGSGLHQWDVSMADFLDFKDFINIAEIIYFPTILGARIAMMVQLRRMFIVTTNEVLWWVYVILLCANIACNTSLVFALLFACDPLDKLWNPLMPGTCINTAYVCLSSSALNGVSDLTMLILPLVVIFQLRLPVKVKLYLCAIFGGGILAIMSSAFRLAYYVLFTKTSDYTWAWEPTGHWAMAEIASVILAGSVPLLPGFMKYARTDEHMNRPPYSNSNSWFGRRQRPFNLTPNFSSISNISPDRTLLGSHKDKEITPVSTPRGNPEFVITKTTSIELREDISPDRS